MQISVSDNLIVLNGKNYILSDEIEKIAIISSTHIVDFFNKKNIKLPRKIRINALRLTFRDLVEKSRVLRSDGFSDEFLYRLNWFNEFSEYQLESLFNIYTDSKLVLEYKKNLWYSIFLNATQIGLTDNDIISIFNSRIGDKEDIISYNQRLLSIFVDEKEEFDGLGIATFRRVLAASSTLVDIRDLGNNKYKINVPKRLKKEELLQIIFEELEKVCKLDDAIVEKLKKGSIVSLQRFCKDNNIKASIELKKEELVEYILNRRFESQLWSEQAFDYIVDDVQQYFPRQFNYIEEEPQEENIEDEVEQGEIVYKDEITNIIEQLQNKITNLETEITSLKEEKTNENITDSNELIKKIAFLEEKIQFIQNENLDNNVTTKLNDIDDKIAQLQASDDEGVEFYNELVDKVNGLQNSLSTLDHSEKIVDNNILNEITEKINLLEETIENISEKSEVVSVENNDFEVMTLSDIHDYVDAKIQSITENNNETDTLKGYIDEKIGDFSEELDQITNNLYQYIDETCDKINSNINTIQNEEIGSLATVEMHAHLEGRINTLEKAEKGVSLEEVNKIIEEVTNNKLQQVYGYINEMFAQNMKKIQDDMDTYRQLTDEINRNMKEQIINLSNRLENATNKFDHFVITRSIEQAILDSKKTMDDFILLNKSEMDNIKQSMSEIKEELDEQREYDDYMDELYNQYYDNYYGEKVEENDQENTEEDESSTSEIAFDINNLSKKERKLYEKLYRKELKKLKKNKK